MHKGLPGIGSIISQLSTVMQSQLKSERPIKIDIAFVCGLKDQTKIKIMPKILDRIDHM